MILAFYFYNKNKISKVGITNKRVRAFLSEKTIIVFQAKKNLMAQILIIDDDAMVCETLLSIFNGMGHIISYQQTLKEGVAQIDSCPMDVVFFDVGLPDGNGLDAIEIIK